MKKLQYIQPQVDIMTTIMPTTIYCASTGDGGDASDLISSQEGVSPSNPLLGD